ncbi:MAG: hypothetical protein WC819_03305 [Parcubacteria group bacterium]
MGLYIRPASLVQEKGKRISFPASWNEAQEQLSNGQGLSAVAERPHGLVALLIQSQADFDHVHHVGGDLYIINEDLVSRAS